MKKTYSFLIIFLAVFSLGHSQLSYSLSNKFWRLKYARINGKEYAFNSSNDNAPTLQFSGGSIRGNGGCNAYHTRFTIDGNTADISRIASTRMACSDAYLDESLFFNALGQQHTISYVSGDEDMSMTNASGDKLVFFAQFTRSAESFVPPARRAVADDAPRERHVTRRARAEAPEAIIPSMSKKEAARQRDLEKKKKKGKLSKQEKAELNKLAGKQNEISRAKVLAKKKKRGTLSRKERNELKTISKKAAKSSGSAKAKKGSKKSAKTTTSTKAKSAKKGAVKAKVAKKKKKSK